MNPLGINGQVRIWVRILASIPAGAATTDCNYRKRTGTAQFATQFPAGNYTYTGGEIPKAA